MRAPGPVPIARLALAVLFGYLSLGATLQELPGFLTGRFGASTATVAAVVGIAFAGTALGRPLAGWAGDCGHARAVAGSGAALTAAAGAGHLLAPDLGALIAARVAMGLGEAALFSGTLPWVLRAVEPGRAGRVAGCSGCRCGAGCQRDRCWRPWFMRRLAPTRSGVW